MEFVRAERSNRGVLSFMSVCVLKGVFLFVSVYVLFGAFSFVAVCVLLGVFSFVAMCVLLSMLTFPPLVESSTPPRLMHIDSYFVWYFLFPLLVCVFHPPIYLYTTQF